MKKPKAADVAPRLRAGTIETPQGMRVTFSGYDGDQALVMAPLLARQVGLALIEWAAVAEGRLKAPEDAQG